MSITENTLYRIQNADWQTYVELIDTSFDGEVGVRPLKRKSLKQQWYFEKAASTPMGNTWKIKNAANGLMYIGSDKSGTGLASKNKARAIEWTPWPGNDGFFQFTNSNSDLLQLEGTKLSLTSTVNDDEKQKWRMVDVDERSPQTESVTLPDGLYRIRSFSGTQVLTVPTTTDENRIYIKKQDGDDLSQQWSVEILTNGKYEIKSGARDVYLANEPAAIAEKAYVKALDSSLAWELRHFAGFAFQIRIPYTGGKGDLAIGFPDYESQNGAEVVLMHPDAGTSSQIWFFEKWGNSGKNSIHGSNSKQTPVIIQPPKTDPNMYPSLRPYPVSNGSYYLLSVDGYFACVDPNDKHTLFPGKQDRVFADGLRPDAKFDLKTVGQKSSNLVTFEIQKADKYGKTNYLSSRRITRGSVLGRDPDPKEATTYELFTDGGEGFYLCVYASYYKPGYARQAVQGKPTISDGRLEFTIPDLPFYSLPDKSFMWKLLAD